MLCWFRDLGSVFCSMFFCKYLIVLSTGFIHINYVICADETLVDQAIQDSGPRDCYQCHSVGKNGEIYDFCPKNGTVDPSIAYKQECKGPCFTRSAKDNDKQVYRGCTYGEYGIPNPLPADGCYKYSSNTWCICRNDTCNKEPLGYGETELDAHLKGPNAVLVNKDGANKCYVCHNYDIKGQNYPQCPKDDEVNLQKAYKENCTGACFVRNDDVDDRIIYRGCTDSQYNLPDPLPPDGCYTYYREIWCVCDGYLCNRGKFLSLGEPKVEFDSHIKNGAVLNGYNVLFLSLYFGFFVLIS